MPKCVTQYKNQPLTFVECTLLLVTLQLLQVTC